ncbi:MAG: nucleotidyltransferase domain-containing protein [Desulfuromonadaceae bacterium]|nr:nucleotidyltransferase domain-containing protein [Desulfuromonadaceae bacterium]MDD5104516.1 nucleotidyltransferase domain-containing protein [Desulfuromonadaceae bacterium]
MVTQDIRNIIGQFVTAVSLRGIHVDKALLYGSVATGNDTSDSDFDVAIISSDFGHDRFKEGKMLTQLAWRIDTRIHPVPVSADSYSNDTWVPLIHEIRMNGIEVA